MVDCNLSPNLVTYNSLIQGQCKEGHLDSAFKLLTIMTENGLAPDQWTYSMLIDTLCKQKKVDEALGLFESLPDKGVKTNEVIYTALIDGYCKVEKTELAHSLLEKMLADNCSPNSHTYNVLIDGLCKDKKIHEASLLLNKMAEVGLETTVVTYTILIDEMLKEGKLGDAQRILDQMVSLGLQPDVCTWTTFVCTYCGQGKFEEAEDIMVKMNKEGILPDLVAYTALMDGYGTWGLVDHAFDVFKRMTDDGCNASEVTYSILFKHLLNEERNREKINHIDINSAANQASIHIADVWKKLDFKTVLRLLDKMIEHDCPPTMNTFDVLIAGFCKERRLEEVQNLFLYMNERGLVPNEKIYTSLVNCLCKLEMYKEALIKVDMMADCGYQPCLESYKLLVCGFYDKGKSEEAKKVFCSLLGCEFNHDEIAWKILIDGLLKKGFVDRCTELLDFMEEKNCPPNHQTYAMIIAEIPSGNDGSNDD
ncbi:hypothetical protein Sjap_026337 [Stephania japonica]|uniref:Pentatricopeptide repeat-containing protein n=1 Tax=Stephania japonica TaxID=461633 RepID=A0AAP0E3I5_9MAGN